MSFHPQEQKGFFMKHCILVKYNETVTAERKEELLSEIKGVFSPLLEMEGIYAVEVIPNIIDRPNRYDVVIRIDMNKDSLPAYDESKPHKVWKQDYAKYLDKKAIFDYEV